MKFGENLPRSIFEILKSELGKFISNFPFKHVITSTNKINFNNKFHETKLSRD